MKKIMLIIGLLVFYLVGCVSPPPSSPPIQAEEGIKTFSSEQELVEYLEQAKQHQELSFGIGFGGGFETDMVLRSVASDSFAESAPLAQAASASEYSETNIQVQGVDEADFVKNDGKYIYMISENNLIMVDAFPAQEAKILSTTNIQGQGKQLFIGEDVLVLFSNDYEETMKVSSYDYIPYPRHTTVTQITIYDISDRSKPKILDQYSLTGRYHQSRMIDGVVYVISQERLSYARGLVDLPVVRSDERIVAEPVIHYFDNPEDNYVFHSVMAIDVSKGVDRGEDDFSVQTYMMGYANTLYMSEDHLYITYKKNFPYTHYRQHNLDRFYEVVLPLLPSSTKEEIGKLDRYDVRTPDQIASLLETMYNTMEQEKREQLTHQILDAVDEYELKLQVENAKTVIHKIRVDGLTIDYLERGEVPGTLLNQFSLDEHENNLRVATTFNVWAGGESILYNNVYVLDQSLNLIGELEDIAPDERIYSTRFIGDRLYMVTFKQIDPFFVIDLSEPTTPTILGELKIPGFSDYLHPYDENHIIGVGKETENNQWGGVSTAGVKLALFDVSDVTAPKEVDKIEIGMAGSDSEALRDHKAFLFDKEKNLLVLPIREVSDRYKDPVYNFYRNRVWQGAFVLGLTPQEGFEIKGKITHEEDGDDRHYWYSPSAVRRSLYMDDVLYTISLAKIKMNDIDSIEEINEIELPQESKRPSYPTPFPVEPIILEG